MVLVMVMVIVFGIYTVFGFISVDMPLSGSRTKLTNSGNLVRSSLPRKGEVVISCRSYYQPGIDIVAVIVVVADIVMVIGIGIGIVIIIGTVIFIVIVIKT